MKNLCWILILGMSFLELGAQHGEGFTPEQIERNHRRWKNYQPHAAVALENGDTISGQPIHFDGDTLYLFLSDSLPLDLQGKLLPVAVSQNSRVQLHRGGRSTKFQISGAVLGTAAGMGIGALIAGPPGVFIGGNLLGLTGGLTARSVFINGIQEEIWLNPVSLEYEEDLRKIREWPVLADSLFYTSDLRELPPRSASIRRAFPQKHLRISLGVSWGPSTFEDQIREALERSDMPPWDEFTYVGWGFDLIDVSWRMKNRWIIGGSWMRCADYMAYASDNPYYSEIEPFSSYQYNFSFQDLYLYSEYVFSPIDRFFTRRSEFLLGAGIIYSMSKVSFSWYYEDPSMWEEPDYESQYYDQLNKSSIFGFQLRSAYHYYLFRNLSLSGGFELNLYQNLEVPDQIADDGNLLLKAHQLNYSTVRLKFGAHLYF